MKPTNEQKTEMLASVTRSTKGGLPILIAWLSESSKKRESLLILTEKPIRPSEKA